MNSFYKKIKHMFPDINILINTKNKELELLKYNIDKFGGIEYFMLFSSHIITNFLDLSKYQKIC